MILDGVFGYERQGQAVIPNDFGTNYGLQFGIPNTNGPDIRQSGFPNIGSRQLHRIRCAQLDACLPRIEESYTHSDNLT